jgi:hypothetical protein
VLAEDGALVWLEVVTELKVVVAVPVRLGQISLPDRRATGYSTLGSPLVSVTTIRPLESAANGVQLMTSTRPWFASKPVAEDNRVTVADEGEPTLVNTATTWKPGLPLRVAIL